LSARETISGSSGETLASLEFHGRGEATSGGDAEEKRKLPWVLADLTSLISHELTGSLVAGFEDFLSFHNELSVISQSYDMMKNGPFDPI